jgi:hypothetical protein
VTPGTVIDKVEVRIPAATQFTKEFGLLYSDCSRDDKTFRQSRYYLKAGDLRSYGYQSVLHMYCIPDKAGNHKLELIDAGEMSFTRIQREIMRIFDTDPWQLGIMRIDLAADLPGVPVPWFARNARVKWKRWACENGKTEYSMMGSRKIEPLMEL